jgi:hypothetical protein
MVCFVDYLIRRGDEVAKSISAHVTANVYEYIGLEGHVHVHRPNDKTNLSLDHVQHSWDKFRVTFSRRHQRVQGQVLHGSVTYHSPSTFL